MVAFVERKDQHHPKIEDSDSGKPGEYLLGATHVTMSGYS